MRHCARRDFVTALGNTAIRTPSFLAYASERRELEAPRARRQERLDGPRLRGGEERR